MSYSKIAGRFSKEFFLESNGFSRQFVFKKNRTKEEFNLLKNSLLEKVKEARKTHKTMGSRVLFHHLNIKEVGINRFEKLVSEAGLSVKTKRKRIVTTNGVHEDFDENLISGKTLNAINQVIAGDITYVQTIEKTYYVFTLKDMYSRRIVGLWGSDRMYAKNAVKALKQAILLRGASIKNCIHHSDAGGQYKSNIYKNILKINGLQMSIAENCLQNGMAEQLNGIIKNGYLETDIKNVNDLNQKLKKIKRLLNQERPVKALGYKTPVEFEEWLKEQEKPPELGLYDFKIVEPNFMGDFFKA